MLRTSAPHMLTWSFLPEPKGWGSRCRCCPHCIDVGTEAETEGWRLDTSRTALEPLFLTSSGMCQNTQKMKRETRLFHLLPKPFRRDLRVSRTRLEKAYH